MSALEPSVSVRFAGDGEAEPPVVVKESVARQFKYFQRVLHGEFQEGQQRQICIEGITRATGLVVLQRELDIVKLLTKDNLLDAMIALDYLHFDTDQIFTPRSHQSLLWRIHRRVVVDGWLRDRQLADSLLQSFGKYAFIARFIHQHKDILTGLLPALRNNPDVIRAQWRSCEGGEDDTDDAIKAAVSLVASVGDGLSKGCVDMGRQEIAKFLTDATGSSSLAAAHAASFEADVFTLTLPLTARPFANNQQGSIGRGAYPMTVVGLPHPYTPLATVTSPGLPANAIRDGDARFLLIMLISSLSLSPTCSWLICTARSALSCRSSSTDSCALAGPGRDARKPLRDTLSVAGAVAECCRSTGPFVTGRCRPLQLMDSTDR